MKADSSNSINFTWTQLWNKNSKSGKGITQFTWAYNVAIFTTWKEFQLIKWKHESVINKIPNGTLMTYASQINSVKGTDLKTAQEVKDYINDWSVDYDVLFCKAWECLNDTISVKLNIAWGVTLSWTSSAESYKQINRVRYWSLLYSPEIARRITTTPWVEGYIETHPWAIVNPDGTITWDGITINPTNSPIYGRNGELYPMVDLTNFGVVRWAWTSNDRDKLPKILFHKVPSEIKYYSSSDDVLKRWKEYDERAYEAKKDEIIF
jgi:hypothetical protein